MGAAMRGDPGAARMGPVLRAMAFGAACALACQGGGQAEDAATASVTATAADTDTDTDPDPDPGSTGGEPDLCAGPRDPGPAPLRRLTPRQYNNSVRDLFPGVALAEQTIAPDPAVHGFENNAAAQAPSGLLIEQYQRAALAVTEAAMAQTAAFLPCPADGGADPSACGRGFLRDFGGRAFRRPLSPDEDAAFLAFFDQQLAEHGFAVALPLTLQAFLQAPAFLYLLELEGLPDGGPRVALTGHELAARLSYFLWDTTPDAALLAAAAAGELDTEAGLAAEAARMLADPRARDAAREFFRQWLALDAIAAVAPDPAAYPQFTPELRASMRQEIERFVLSTMFEGTGTLAALLTSNAAEVDAALADLYGAPAPPAGQWAALALDPERRAGLLTRAGFLAATAHAVHPSPVRRGAFVLARLLCAPPGAPPPNVDTSPPDPAPGDPQTNRERYAEHSDRPECAGCHAPIDGVGFGFEHYDAIGRWRALDGGLPVDARGELLGTDVDGPFTGAPELSRRLADSDQVHACLALHAFRHALGRSEDASDACRRDELDAAFTAAGGDLQALLLALVASDAFRFRRAD